MGLRLISHFYQDFGDCRTKSECPWTRFTLPAMFPIVRLIPHVSFCWPIDTQYSDQSKLHLSMSRFFRRLPVDKPVIRNNYGFQVVRPAEPSAAEADPIVAIDPTELAWSRTMHGHEDKLDFERSAVIRGTLSPTNQIHASATEPLDPAMVYMRTERQTLRRLPKTGGIAFTIRVYQTPVVELAKEPGVPGRLASSIRGWSEEVAQCVMVNVWRSVFTI